MADLLPHLDEFGRTLDVLEREETPLGVPMARDRAVGIARLLLARVEELETAAERRVSDDGAAQTGGGASVVSLPGV
jgi:hypothetical protein